MTQAILHIQPHGAEIQALPETYLACWAAAVRSDNDLRNIANELLNRGLDPCDLIDLALLGGYDKAYVCSTLNRLLSERGSPSPKNGAGLTTPLAALLLMEMARDNHGSDATKLLFSAARASRALDHGGSQPDIALSL